MEIILSTVHGDITPDMKEYAEKKVGRVSKFFSKGTLSVNINLGVKERNFLAESVLSVKNHSSMVAKAKSDDMFKAIDSMVEKLERQVRDLKEKRTSNRKRSSQRLQAAHMEDVMKEAFTSQDEESEE